MPFVGDELAVQVAGATVKAKDPVIGEPKQQMHFIAFDGEIGLRRLRVAK